MTSEKDFKSELSATQNLMLCMGLSQKTVLHCTQEFVDNDLKNYISAVSHVLQEVRQVASPTNQKTWLVAWRVGKIPTMQFTTRITIKCSKYYHIITSSKFA